MPLKNINPTTTSAWKKLASHFEEMDTFSLKKAFNEDPNSCLLYTSPSPRDS